MSDGGGARETHPHPSHHHPSPQNGLISSTIHARQLLISCAELVHCGDLPAADRAIAILSAAASPCGDSTERLIRQFCRALSVRVGRVSPSADSLGSLRSSYLSFNQISPFLRFSHLTPNQAILEAAIAERSDPSDPPFIRITETGSDLEVLRRTGHRLQNFAHSLGLGFQFHPLLLHPTSTSLNFTTSPFPLHPGETLVVNCVLFLHKLQKEGGSRDLQAFLRTIRAMNPSVVTVAEREASHNSPNFMQRFVEALDYYMAVFDSLEATLPPTSQERLEVEQVWLGQEIEDIVGGEGGGHERSERWENVLRDAGFSSLQLSTFAVSQARLLLRLHYPSEGYQVELVRDSLLLGWQNRHLFSVSSWR
ncbi:Scarecrow-like protein 18 [Musa troglodytarum]|nr:Scarecrow-like protein 18 [Musa troglodytarum]